MIVLAGASASGKTEVAKLLAKKYGITKAITTTTRDMRTGEVDGKDYFFISKEKFKQKLNDDLFVEYTFYNDNLYGSTKDQITEDKCVVIDPAGLKSYTALKNKHFIVTFFLEADEDTRRQRMISRGDEEKKIISRIKNDREAFKPENIATVDFVVDSSQNRTIEEVADEIFAKYNSKK